MVQTDLRAVSKKFFVLYYPVLLIIMITNITLSHTIGFNPMGVPLPAKIIGYNVWMMIVFFAFIVVRKFIKLQGSWVWGLYILFALLISELIFFILRAFVLQIVMDNPNLNSFNVTMMTFLRSCNALSFLFLFFLAEKSYLSEKRFQAEQMKWVANEKKWLKAN